MNVMVQHQNCHTRLNLFVLASSSLFIFDAPCASALENVRGWHKAEAGTHDTSAIWHKADLRKLSRFTISGTMGSIQTLPG
jgi:hypothetical protein